MTVLHSAWNFLFPIQNQAPSSLQEKVPKKETKLLLEGSQDGKVGPTHHQTMMKAFDKVLSHREPGVYFNRNRLVNYLYGGTCTAMVLGFIDDFLKTSGADLQKRLICVMKNYTSSSEVFRAQQIAFNTIEMSQLTQTDDFKKAKIQSLLNFKDLEIDYTSKDMNLEEILANPEDFKAEVEKLPEGVYFLRILCPNDNFKKEAWGHSTVFVRDQAQGDYFYDPNYGLTEIAEGESVQFLLEHFQALQSVWLVDNPRFYRIKA